MHEQWIAYLVLFKKLKFLAKLWGARETLLGPATSQTLASFDICDVDLMQQCCTTPPLWWLTTAGPSLRSRQKSHSSLTDHSELYHDQLLWQTLPTLQRPISQLNSHRSLSAQRWPLILVFLFTGILPCSIFSCDFDLNIHVLAYMLS